MPVSKAQQKSVNKYVREKYDRINITMPKGKKDIIQSHAAIYAQSVNAYINSAIDEAISRDGAQQPTAAADASKASVDIPIPETPQNAAQAVSAPAIAISDIPLEKWEQVKAHTEARREPISGFLVRAINEAIERDKSAPAASQGDSEGVLNDND